MSVMVMARKRKGYNEKTIDRIIRYVDAVEKLKLEQLNDYMAFVDSCFGIRIKDIIGRGQNGTEPQF